MQKSIRKLLRSKDKTLYDISLNKAGSQQPDILNELNDVFSDKIATDPNYKYNYGDGIANFSFKVGKGVDIKNNNPNWRKFNKYFIDISVLKNKNLLELRYLQNRRVNANFPAMSVNIKVRDILLDIIEKNTLNKDSYNSLTDRDKYVINKFLEKIDRTDLMVNANDAFSERFKILLGEYNAGNNSQQLINELRGYIRMAIQHKLIPKQQGIDILLELSSN